MKYLAKKYSKKLNKRLYKIDNENEILLISLSTWIDQKQIMKKGWFNKGFFKNI